VLARLGQWIPRFPAPGRQQPYDPVAQELARAIGELSDQVGSLWAACTNATNHYDDLLASRVGLPPAQYDAPGFSADPGLVEAYNRAFRLCERQEAMAGELNRLKAMLRQRTARRMAALRIAPALRAFRIPFVGY
jgi:hypothetical protein